MNVTRRDFIWLSIILLTALTQCSTPDVQPTNPNPEPEPAVGE